MKCHRRLHLSSFGSFEIVASRGGGSSWGGCEYEFYQRLLLNHSVLPGSFEIRGGKHRRCTVLPRTSVPACSVRTQENQNPATVREAGLGVRCAATVGD